MGPITEKAYMYQGALGAIVILISKSVLLLTTKI